MDDTGGTSKTFPSTQVIYMRKIIVTANITLDRVMQGMGGPNEDPSGNFKYGGWSVPHTDVVSGTAVQKYMDAKADYLLGRKTFEIFHSVWPQRADIWPQISEGTKYVFSNTLEKSDWKNTVFLNKLEDLRKLKNSNGQIFRFGAVVNSFSFFLNMI